MKKTTTILLLVSLGLILTGAVLFCIGAASASFRFDEFGFDEWNGPVETKTHEITESFSSISVKDISGDVRILPSTDGTCKVVCRETERQYVTVETVGDTLTVIRHDGRHWYEHIGFFIELRDMDVTLYLPEEAYQSLTLRSVSGNVQVSSAAYTFSKVTLESTSGDIALNGRGNSSLVTDFLRLHTVSGNMSVAQLQGETYPEIEATATSGDLKLNSVNCKSLWIKTVSGDVDLQTILSDGKVTINTTSGDMKLQTVLSDGKITIDTTSGDVDLEYVDADSFDIDTTSGDVEGILLSGKQFETDTTSGKVRVPASEPGAGICRIDTTSGDIEIRVQSK